MEVKALGYYVNRAFFSLVRLLNKFLKERDLDIQHSEFSILRVLKEIKGGSQTQLASILGKERSGIGRTLSSLEAKGFINRESLNGTTNFVTLTEKGQEVLPVLDEVIDQVTERAFKGFPQKSRETLIKNLTKIYLNSLDTLPPPILKSYK